MDGRLERRHVRPHCGAVVPAASTRLPVFPDPDHHFARIAIGPDGVRDRLEGNPLRAGLLLAVERPLPRVSFPPECLSRNHHHAAQQIRNEFGGKFSFGVQAEIMKVRTVVTFFQAVDNRAPLQRDASAVVCPVAAVCSAYRPSADCRASTGSLHCA